MVNLNRQIRATQARQGGFSSHVLPGAVGYDPVRTLVFYTNGSQLLSTDPGTEVNPEARYYFAKDVATSSYQCQPLYSALSFAASGGPFGEPYIEAVPANAGELTPNNCRERPWQYMFTHGPTFGLASSFFSSLSPEQIGRWTWEMFYRMNADPSAIWSFGLGNFIGYGSAMGSTDLWFSPGVASAFIVGPRVTGQWRHFAMQRDGIRVTAYDNGARIFDGDMTGGIRDNYHGAHIDVGQTRITAGAIRYSGATITPPTAPFIAV